MALAPCLHHSFVKLAIKIKPLPRWDIVTVLPGRNLHIPRLNFNLIADCGVITITENNATISR